MPTPFPVDTYPLLQGETQEDASRVERDIASDGTPFVRVMTSEQYRTIPLTFAPLRLAECRALMDYLSANAAEKFSIVMQSATYVGYLWSDATAEHSNNMYHVKVKFYGKVTV